MVCFLRERWLRRPDRFEGMAKEVDFGRRIIYPRNVTPVEGRLLSFLWLRGNVSDGDVNKKNVAQSVKLWNRSSQYLISDLGMIRM
jgi:hypothetical protein